MVRLLLLCGLVLLATVRPLAAATFNIANGDVAGLKAAIIACRTNGQDDFINLAAGGIYTLTTLDNSTNGNNGLPVVIAEAQHSITINGNGATIQRSAANGVPGFRVLYLSCDHAFCTSRPTTINDLTITGGYATDPVSNIAGFGGGIYTEYVDAVLVHCALTQNLADRRGGGISNSQGSLEIDYSTLNLNRCSEGGAAIDNAAALTVLASTFDGNRSSAGPGGAFYNFGGGTLAAATVTSCTFNNNTGGGNTGGVFNNFVTGQGGAATIVFTHCTFRVTDVLNSGQYTGGPAPTAKITLRNCLFSDSKITNNTNPGHTRVQIVSEGFNLSSNDGGGNLTGPNDQINTDPKLDPAGLQDNGGLNLTIGLTSDSPALDHGNAFGVAIDQRGNFRTRDLSYVPNGPGTDGTDIGALESAEPKQAGPNFTVNTVSDHDDGLCGAADCTLREAIHQSNGLTSGSAVISVNQTGTVTLNGNELVVTRALQITGPGARMLAISANNLSRVFSFVGAIDCALSGLTIRDGLVSGNSGVSTVGGGIYNEGTLALNDCALLHNRLLGGSGASNSGQDGGMARGGGIFNGGALTLNHCAVGGADANSANSATGGTGADHPNDGEILYNGGKGGAALGGAIYNDTSAALTINNCTIAGNTATGGAGGAANHGGAGGEGTGGIYNSNNMTVTAATISANSGNGGAGGRGQFTLNNGAAGRGIGGVHSNAGTATIRSSIIAANTHTQSGGIDVEGAFVSSGFNLIGTASNATGFTAATDLAGTNTALVSPSLGPIQNNGGATDTMALLTGSPALDHGNSFGLTSDQRGRVHSDDPILGNAAGGDGTDTGAYESSYARIIGITRGGAAATITFIGTVGRQFQLQRRFSFTTAWTVDPFSQNTVLSAGQTMQLIDTHANDSPKIYYRIQEL